MVYICKYCNKNCEKSTQVASHMRWCKVNPNRVIKSKKPHPLGKKHFTGRKHSEETKKLISEKRKKYLSENKDKHPWSRFSNLESEPEKRFRILIEKTNLPIKQWVTPEESDRAFELDFADCNAKIAFEINGNQHYESDGKTLKKYYQDRHDHFVNLGWKIIEVHYSIAFDESLASNLLRLAYDNFIMCEDKIQEITNHRVERKRLREEKKIAAKLLKQAKKEIKLKNKMLGIKEPLTEKQKIRRENTLKRREAKKAAKKAERESKRNICPDWSNSTFTQKEIEFHLKSRKVMRPSKEELAKLIWEQPTTHIAKFYGVSDKAIEKWAKGYGITKPPRGYWTKKQSNGSTTTT